MLVRAAENRIFNENRWHREEEHDVGMHDDDSVIINNPLEVELRPQWAGFLHEELEGSNRPGH